MMPRVSASAANIGAAGVDRQVLGEFEADLKDILQKIWNRMSSGRFPVLVKAVEICGERPASSSSAHPLSRAPKTA
jgi:hypothetical protein